MTTPVIIGQQSLHIPLNRCNVMIEGLDLLLGKLDRLWCFGDLFVEGMAEVLEGGTLFYELLTEAQPGSKLFNNK